ncbi:hypothetical protein KP509_01G022600 [Ceratopteris richardii]|uniref:Uncharacterized protein n=2 Tax=Ceratopteris richardii TaxID=49495 RepID=A0A8T2VEW2_CERRI|nr:hypothetical protein KP509_01G022600 [Ceratopteris richardii]
MDTIRELCASRCYWGRTFLSSRSCSRFPFQQLQLPCLHAGSSAYLIKSYPVLRTHSFLREGAGSSKTNSVDGRNRNLQRSQFLNGRNGGHDEEQIGRNQNEPLESSEIVNGCGNRDDEENSFVDDHEESVDEYGMMRVADKLIDIFLVERTTSDEWRKLLAFSKEWNKIRPHFFKRCRARAEQENDPERKGNLSRLCRKLKEVDDDMERHNELFSFAKANETDIYTVVTRRRKDFTLDFFQHLELLYQASYQQPDQQNDIANIAQKCAAAVEAYDKTEEEEEAVVAAQMKFEDILNSPSLDIARNKIDELAKRNELDSTLMLMITKAWAASKESSMMKEEAKDILYHLYMVARGNMQRLVPKDVRILRHVLTLKDPKEQLAALTEAFSPGAELEGKDVDLLYTTPEQLYKWIVIVLDAYYNNQKNSLMKSAQELMSPSTIGRLEALKRTLEKQFL